MQPLQNFIGPTISIGQRILCLPYAGFFLVISIKFFAQLIKTKTLEKNFINVYMGKTKIFFVVTPGQKKGFGQGGKNPRKNYPNPPPPPPPPPQ